MQECGLTEAQKQENTFYQQLITFANAYGRDDEWTICKNIKRFYDEEILPNLPPHIARPWSLTSIRDWVVGRAAEPNTHAYCVQVIHHRIRHIANRELYVRNPRTKRRDLRSPEADTRLMKWLKVFRQFENRRA